VLAALELAVMQRGMLAAMQRGMLAAMQRGMLAAVLAGVRRNARGGLQGRQGECVRRRVRISVVPRYPFYGCDFDISSA
jgi:hypothetical protein